MKKEKSIICDLYFSWASDMVSKNTTSILTLQRSQFWLAKALHFGFVVHYFIFGKLYPDHGSHSIFWFLLKKQPMIKSFFSISNSILSVINNYGLLDCKRISERNPIRTLVLFSIVKTNCFINWKQNILFFSLLFPSISLKGI